MASTYLSRSVSTTTNRRTWTWSGWVKRSDVTTGYQTLFSSYSDSNNYTRILFWDTQQLTVSSKVVGSFTIDYRLTRRFRDTSAWYHIVVAMDTTQATDTNRLKVYINGVLETAYEGSSSSYPPQNEDTFINRNRVHYMGQLGDSTGYFGGSMSHIYLIDGTAYDASAFGETDATTGEWKAKTSPSVTYGTNGFLILKDGNTITDQSSNSNDFTLGGGTLTDLKDNPDNVFCTANALSKGSDTVLSNGNNTARNDTNVNSATIGNIAFGNGKYYWEAYRHGGGNIGIGICLASVDGSSHNSVEDGRVLYYENGSIFCNGLSDQSNITTGVTYTDTDIISVSMDTENGILKFYKNNVLVNNSTITNSKLTNSENIWVPTTYQNNGGEWRLNFGNGYFGTTAVASAGTNASDNGIFEYDVPTGYTALSTKGLNL